MIEAVLMAAVVSQVKREDVETARAAERVVEWLRAMAK